MLSAQDESAEEGPEIVLDERGLLVNPGQRMKQPSPSKLAEMEAELDKIQERLDARMDRLKGALTEMERQDLIERQQADLMEHLELLDSMVLVDQAEWTFADIQDKQAVIGERMVDIIRADSAEEKETLIQNQVEDLEQQVLMIDSWIAQQNSE